MSLESVLFDRGYDVSLTSKLGKGGFGTVYAGVRLCDKAPVAVKFVYSKAVWRWHFTDKGERIPIEIHTLNRVRHVRGVVRLYDWFALADGYVMIMERPINYVSLDKYCREGTLTEAQSIHVFQQLVKIVYECWLQCGILHCDIKDDNVLINREDLSVRLIDFDFAIEHSQRPRKTHAGTPFFAPPEWHIRKRYYPESLVVWTLGVVLFRLIFSQHPFRHLSEIKTFVHVKTLETFREISNKTLSDLLSSMLSRLPHEARSRGHLQTLSHPPS